MANVEKDPLLLGVSMPLSMTKTKALEVGRAWKEAALSLYSVARTKMIPEKPAASSSSSNSATSSTISA